MTRDWAVAQFTDDAGLGVASQYTMPSWNFRSVYSVLGGWPLAPATRSLPNGSPRSRQVLSLAPVRRLTCTEGGDRSAALIHSLTADEQFSPPHSRLGWQLALFARA